MKSNKSYLLCYEKNQNLILTHIKIKQSKKKKGNSNESLCESFDDSSEEKEQLYKKAKDEQG